MSWDCSPKTPPRLMRSTVFSFTEAVIPSVAIIPANDTSEMIVDTTTNNTKANKLANVYFKNDFIVIIVI